eukprot:scaffold27594_cov135-Isochrysis_galbana.AAC.1
MTKILTTEIGTHSLVSKNKGGEQRGSVGSPSHDGGVIQGGPPVGRVEGPRDLRTAGHQEVFAG